MAVSSWSIIVKSGSIGAEPFCPWFKMTVSGVYYFISHILYVLSVYNPTDSLFFIYFFTKPTRKFHMHLFSHSYLNTWTESDSDNVTAELTYPAQIHELSCQTPREFINVMRSQLHRSLFCQTEYSEKETTNVNVFINILRLIYSSKKQY